MRSSLPREKLVVVIAFQLGTHGQEVFHLDLVFAWVRILEGFLSGKNDVTLASTPQSICLSIAMPISMLVMVFVAERVLRNVEASPSKYCSIDQLAVSRDKDAADLFVLAAGTAASATCSFSADMPADSGVAVSQSFC